VKGCILPNPTLEGYEFPDLLEPRFFKDITENIEKYGDQFQLFLIGFSLFERAWTLRGMENLLLDFIINPDFVHEPLNWIADYNITQIREALKYDIDCVHFGDDWGSIAGIKCGEYILLTIGIK